MGGTFKGRNYAEGFDDETVVYPHIAFANSYEKARLDLVLEKLETRQKRSKQVIEKFQSQLQRDLMNLETDKAVHLSKRINVGLCELEKQKELVKTLSQRGKYKVALKKEKERLKEKLEETKEKERKLQRQLNRAQDELLGVMAKTESVDWE